MCCIASTAAIQAVSLVHVDGVAVGKEAWQEEIHGGAAAPEVEVTGCSINTSSDKENGGVGKTAEGVRLRTACNCEPREMRHPAFWWAVIGIAVARKTFNSAAL